VKSYRILPSRAENAPAMHSNANAAISAHGTLLYDFDLASGRYLLPAAPAEYRAQREHSEFLCTCSALEELKRRLREMWQAKEQT